MMEHPNDNSHNSEQEASRFGGRGNKKFIIRCMEDLDPIPGPGV